MDMDQLKRQAAAQALEHVHDGMKLGLGTGSTAKHFVDLLGQRVAGGLRVVGVPTSEATRAQAEACKIPLTTLDEVDRLDLTVDGADELDPALNLIKGGGGALLREKIVAAASDRMIVIADDTKWVDVLGRFPLPVEVIPFGLAATQRAIEAMADLMKDTLGVDDTDAAMLIACAADVRTGIAGHPPYTIRVAVPTSVLTLCN